MQKKIILFSIFGTLVLSLPSLAGPLTIYGEDNRLEFFQSKSAILRDKALSTAAMISTDNLKEVSGKIEINSSLFKDIYKLCSSEKFREQMAAANCSGTLIEKDIILTAGHCFTEKGLSCKGYHWVFDYLLNSPNQTKISVPKSSVYNCKEVISLKVDNKTNIDYALIRLDRKVTDRKPVDIRLTGEVALKDKLAVIGYPRGIPLKIAGSGMILDRAADFLRTNLDAYTMNSGSGVFNEKTGELEGILVSGKMDFETMNNCQLSRRLKDEEGQEIVTKIQAIWDQIDRF